MPPPAASASRRNSSSRRYLRCALEWRAESCSRLCEEVVDGAKCGATPERKCVSNLLSLESSNVYLSGGHSFLWVPSQTPSQKVDEKGVIASFERCSPILRSRRPSLLSTLASTSVQNNRAVGHRRLSTVTRVTTRRDEVFRSFRGFDHSLNIE